MGLTTVVFVDVEGSTALLDRVGDAAGVASVRRQLDVVGERVAAYGGRVVKSLGDGFLLTFSSPRQAVSFALASQRALAGSLPRVRFGINTGEVDDVDTDPLGSAVNAAARIAARADGGEVLVSDVVRQLAGTSPAVRFLDRGRCRLRGFSDRWRLWVAEERTAGAERATATVGRVAELAFIGELVSSTGIGAGGVILIDGEAGIGKTHLVREAVAMARRLGMTVVEVTADELARRPGVVAHGLLAAPPARRVARERLHELLVAGRADGVEDLSYTVIEASVDLVEELAGDQPVLVAVEDLHWSDDLSIGVIAALARRAGVSRFSVIGSMRPSPRPPALDRLVERVRDGMGTCLHLGSLDDVDVNALASAVTGAAAGQSLRARLRVTAGNPLYVMELLRSLDDNGALRIDAGVAEVSTDVGPASLHETLVRRLSWLPAETNELLRFASLLGSSFTIHDVATITGRAVIDVAGWLREASLAGLVVGDGDRLTFRHDLVREAVYGHMLPAERRDLHLAAARALADTGASVQHVAEQYARGALHGDLEAVGWLRRAADDAASISPASAVELLEKAVGLAPADWTGLTPLRAASIEPLVLCGRFDDAQALAKAILASSPTSEIEFEALRGLSAAYGDRGDVATSVMYLQRAAAVEGAPVDEARMLRCIAAQYSMALGSTSAEELQRVAEQTLAEIDVDADPTAAYMAYQGLGLAASATGYGEEARHHYAQAVGLLEAGRVAVGLYQVAGVGLASALLDLDEVDEAVKVAEASRRRIERRGALALVPFAHMITAGAHIYAGRWADALAEVDVAMEISDEIGNHTWVVIGEAVKGWVALHRGDLAAAQAHIAAGTQRLAEVGAFFGADWLFDVQVELLAASGQRDAALRVAEVVWAQTAHIRHILNGRPRGVALVRLAMGAGRHSMAAEVTAELEEGARRTPAASAIGAALQCRGLLEQDPDLLVQAVVRYRQTPRRPETASCCEDAAAVLAAAGRPEEAIALLQEAATIHAELDAAGDTARVDTALKALGVRRSRPRASRPTFGWDSLTPMETDVTRLAAEGLTNPEIGARLYISRRTVETHLSHVFRKLDLTNRTQLVAELSRRTPTR